MTFSLSLIILLGLLSSFMFSKLKLPGLLGMLVLGVILGPYALNVISSDILKISSDLRKIALIIILLRAGLGIKKDTLKKVGSSAIKMSFIPGLFEGFTIMIVSHYLLNFSIVESGMLGFIIAAVSPAVIVPQMLNFIEAKKGEKKGVPTIILAGASIDDVVAITLFSTFIGLYGNEQINIIKKIFDIPLSIFLGILLGVIAAFILIYIFKKFNVNDTKKALIVLGSSILLTNIESFLENIVPIASLLGVMTIGFVIFQKSEQVGSILSDKFNNIWIFAEILLFVLVGSQVNIYVAFESGLLGLLIIITGLLARSLGVFVSFYNTDLNIKEKLFCVISYIPKATVQAAIGAIPLSIGVKSGDIILAIAVLSIIITAPLGAIGIKLSGEKWLG
ncbi:sodium/proton antiporter, CPA1 family [Alkalithermobacter thermoalcaliphilus JW-YL-7 = DSM 7308]|uniref:Sodium/hydrogen exchanger n=1 Tax=Alkalithermobacter thermoalcaliphilus JW-YL-7 = DSM 7308 TaxID=1121328 RepID=A0A150FQ08_CLOPD|nr:sodium/hydrogen exchanger [[Clostridium] paradoxum JW-YL-7 = DSM 7308]SHK64254.1 sodium/proton antiporter, CPA1 family [[Clostridium] paradoxum JW-YL-7 = DSM 7308]